MSSIDVGRVSFGRVEGLPEYPAGRRNAQVSQNVNEPLARVNADQVELSSAARNSSKEAIRTDLVNRIREEIKNGTYETPERLDAAIDGLSNDLLGQ